MEERPIEVSTDHSCVLGELTERVAAAEAGDVATIAADALEAMLLAGTFDRCCLPRYLKLAPKAAEREVQIPVAARGGIETRVLVWPVGSADGEHPHTDGWTAFIPVTGQLIAIDEVPGQGTVPGPLRPRKAAVLRPEVAIRHRLRNQEREVAVTIHVSGPKPLSLPH